MMSIARRRSSATLRSGEESSRSWSETRLRLAVALSGRLVDGTESRDDARAPSTVAGVEQVWSVLAAADFFRRI